MNGIGAVRLLEKTVRLGLLELFIRAIRLGLLIY